MKTLASVSQFFGKTFALWVLVFAALAFYFPATFKVFLPYVSILLGIVMFGMGLTLSVGDFKAVLTRPRDVFIGIVGQFVIMPAIAVSLLGDEPAARYCRGRHSCGLLPGRHRQ